VTDVERAIRESLSRRADVTDVRAMPKGTAGQVRRRRVRFAASVALVTVTAIAAGVVAFRALPGDERSGHVPGSKGPWPPVSETEPGMAFVPDVTGDPEDLTVLTSGTVEGAAFSLVGWTGNKAEYQGPCIAFSGPFTRGGAPEPTDGGFGGRVAENCASWPTPTVPDGADLELLGEQDPSTPGLMANYGFLSPRVARVIVSIGNPADQLDIELLDGPAGWEGVRSFVFFPPPDTEGMLVAFDETGKPLARAVVCASRTDVPGGCRGITEPLVLVGPGVPETIPDVPAGWPVSTYGGDVVPYVDHEVDLDGEMDPGIVSPKVVVTFGRVDDVPWTITSFLSDGESRSAVGPCGQIFLGDEGMGGGADFCRGIGDQDRDLGVTGIGFGDVGVTAYAGIVSPAVDHVEVRLGSGEIWRPELLPGPEEVGARYFVFFPASGISGEIVAVGADGGDLGTSPMCTEIPGPGATSVCG
jgi:hypothetical protein